jgi:thiamine-monophosphate kinase
MPGSRRDLLATTDPVIRGHHFLADTPLEFVGRKAVARAISDIAAMGGEAAWILTDVVAPAAFPANSVRALYGALEKAAREFGLSIVGGDLSEGPDLEIHVMALGTVPHGTAILRSGARPGDALFVTGALGASWTDGNTHQYTFQPRLVQGHFLRARRFASAMMDLSDGLGADLPRLLDASCVSCEIDADSIPLSDAARRTSDPLEHAWSDGEDFELLFAVPPDRVDGLLRAWARRFPGLPISRIGEVLEADAPRTMRVGGKRIALPPGGYNHFRATSC